MEKEKPITDKTRRVLWMGLISPVVGPFVGYINSIIRRILDPISFNPSGGLPMGFAGVFLSLGLAVTTIVLFTKSYKTGERSLFSWIGFIPAVLTAVFWIYMIAGELLFPH